jgi:phosphoesterase RecJ-like protein
MGAVLSTARRDESGRVACMRQSLEMQQQAQASDEDADGFVNYPLTVGEVEAVAMLKECEAGVYRTSLRSKGDVNVARWRRSLVAAVIETRPVVRSREAGRS